jgi:hypothetical protein
MMEQFITISITMKCYGWSKWGGAREGLVKEELDEWYCQACGEKQVKILPSYMFPVDDLGRDFARVCTKCKAKSLAKKISVWNDLLSLLR